MWPILTKLWLALSGNTPRGFAPRRRRAFRRPDSRPCLEALEDRCLLNAGYLDPTFGAADAGLVTHRGFRHLALCAIFSNMEPRLFTGFRGLAAFWAGLLHPSKGPLLLGTPGFSGDFRCPSVRKSRKVQFRSTRPGNSARTLWQASEAPPIDQIPNPRERTLRWEHKEYDYLVCPAAHVEYGAAKPNLRQAASPRGKYLLPQSIEMFPDRNRPVPLTMGQRLGAGTKRPKRECQAQQVNPSLHHGVPRNRPDLLVLD